MLLDVHDLNVTYRTGGIAVPAVRGIDLQLDAGQTLGVAGESGSGKSTLALSLLRLLPEGTDVSGRVLFRGDDLLEVGWGKLRAVRWAQASIVFQGAMSALNPVRTIGEQIREPILLHENVGMAAARKRAAQLLDDVGVPSRRATAYPHELSGGQRQRVMIAMALACRPQLVIADEPTTALDVIVQAQVLDLLTELVRESGIGMIMISHDLSVLAQTCDRLAVMYAGRIAEIGPSNDVMDTAAHPYTRALSQAFPVIGDRASRYAPAGLPGDPLDPTVAVTGCPFRPRCPEAIDVCAGVDPPLWPAGPARAAACVHVLAPAELAALEAATADTDSRAAS
jgi:peptide/nickel transport system ATP-binding protein